MTNAKRIAVIGAGISGLVTASALQQRGYAITVFEKDKTIGGSWARSIFYVGEVAQTIRQDYTFYNSGLPPLSGEWPDGEEMQQYLQAYASKSRMYQYISFCTTVQKIHFDKNGWSIAAWDSDDNRHIEQKFDAVVVCTGFEADSYHYTNGAIRFKGNHLNTMLNNKDRWCLYRHIGVAGSESIGFVGMNGGLYFTLTATIAAHWMAAYLSGDIQTPVDSPSASRFRRYSKKKELSQLTHYLNLLLKDMGSKPPAGSNLLLRLMGQPFHPEAYIDALNRVPLLHDRSSYNMSHAGKPLKTIPYRSGNQ
ncbi:FAD-dependent oxidoreductase [Niabella drilacis]|uniref:Flavin-binding monooxygenase-like n=1 Tax=Niabella drilacis (strain DSM 25811 / CCM 8410 / CCUG 62505 / LMG 26954 / E90) TaxID=1285928 RepID=A0A1G6WJT5_NIADE|nr:FAD-dependent oxidoreductase [Niabella drilacis]SDD66071.1 Flavin-binding monooxygenase-like [Niabella drilacis]